MTCPHLVPFAVHAAANSGSWRQCVSGGLWVLADYCRTTYLQGGSVWTPCAVSCIWTTNGICKFQRFNYSKLFTVLRFTSFYLLFVLLQTDSNLSKWDEVFRDWYHNTEGKNQNSWMLLHTQVLKLFFHNQRGATSQTVNNNRISWSCIAAVFLLPTPGWRGGGWDGARQWAGHQASFPQVTYRHLGARRRGGGGLWRRRRRFPVRLESA